jgi:hypothetical protein
MPAGFSAGVQWRSLALNLERLDEPREQRSEVSCAATALRLNVGRRRDRVRLRAEHSLGGKERYPRPRRELVSYGMGKSARVAKPLGPIHPVVHIGESEWDFQMKPERPVRGCPDRADLYRSRGV